MSSLGNLRPSAPSGRRPRLASPPRGASSCLPARPAGPAPGLPGGRGRAGQVSPLIGPGGFEAGALVGAWRCSWHIPTPSRDREKGGGDSMEEREL